MAESKTVTELLQEHRAALTERLRENLRRLQGESSDRRMAEIIGAKHGTTWKRRLERPETLTVDEALRLCEAFCVEPDGLFEAEIRIGRPNR